MITPNIAREWCGMVPFVDFKKQYRTIRPEILAAIEPRPRQGRVRPGGRGRTVEREFAQHCDVAHAVVVNTGASARHLALLAAGVSPGDEVITTPFTFVATLAAIVNTAAQPVLVDIDQDSYTIDSAHRGGRQVSHEGEHARSPLRMPCGHGPDP